MKHVRSGRNTTRTGKLLTKQRRAQSRDREQIVRSTLTDLERWQRAAYKRLSNLLLELGMIDELVELARQRVSEL